VPLVNNDDLSLPDSFQFVIGLQSKATELAYEPITGKATLNNMRRKVEKEK
jgi:hypothetical protein